MEIENLYVPSFGGNYGRAMAEVRRRRFLKKLPTYAWRALCLGLVIYIFSIPGVAFWTAEIFGSILLFAFVYILLPFFLFATGLTIMRHRKVVLRAMWDCLGEAAEYMRIIR